MKKIIILLLILNVSNVVAQKKATNYQKYSKVYTHDWEGIHKIKLNIKYPLKVIKDTISFYDETAERNNSLLLEKLMNMNFTNDSLRGEYLNDLINNDIEGHKRKLTFYKGQSISNKIDLVLLYIGASGNNLNESLKEALDLNEYVYFGEEKFNKYYQFLDLTKIKNERLLIGKQSVVDTTNQDLFVASSFVYYLVRKVNNDWIVVFTINTHYASRSTTRNEDKICFGFLAEINKSITFKTFFNGRNTK
jgi:hypothetical protein